MFGESPERFQAFLTSRLLPTLERHGIGAPQASPWPVYHTLTP